MPFTLNRFAEKLRDLQGSLGSTWEDVSADTGIGIPRLQSLAAASERPSGDEILILADYFRCEFTWLMEDEAKNPDENLRTLFRFEGDKLSTEDRHSINEFLFLCKCEALLEELLLIRGEKERFSFPRQTGVYASQGEHCARAIRDYYEIGPTGIVPDIFYWLRKEGFRVFRRKLSGSPISGLFVDHPTAGRCVLINADEDIYRQRFSAAHELGHALLDQDVAFNVSTEADQRSREYREIRANRFASCFLIPSGYLRRRTSVDWRKPEVLSTSASELRVSVPALLAALKREGIIDAATRDEFRALGLRPTVKRDPEIPEGLNQSQIRRLQTLLELGLHRRYVANCFEAYRGKLVSWGKLAEMLLVTPGQVPEIGETFGVKVDVD